MEKNACSSLVTATMNEKQLQGMLHYHPISSTGGGELVVSLHKVVCRIMCLKEAGGVGWVVGGAQHWPTDLQLH